jgi:hypothetical protein
MEYDKIFDDATVKDLDFEVIFDEEDSIIEQVVGFGENGESLIGRDPEELTTDNDDSKVDIEGSSSDTTLKDGDGAEIKESGEIDLDNLFEGAECGLEPGKGGDAEEQTDETDKKDVLAEPDEVEDKDFHDESVDLDKLFEGCGEGCEGCSEEGEDIPATDAVEDDEDLEESYNIGGAKHINWFGEESIEAETDTEDELINTADNNDSAQNLNLDYQVGLDDEVIDDLIDSDI